MKIFDMLSLSAAYFRQLLLIALLNDWLVWVGQPFMYYVGHVNDSHNLRRVCSDFRYSKVSMVRNPSAFTSTAIQVKRGSNPLNSLCT